MIEPLGPGLCKQFINENPTFYWKIKRTCEMSSGLCCDVVIRLFAPWTMKEVNLSTRILHLCSPVAVRFSRYFQFDNKIIISQTQIWCKWPKWLNRGISITSSNSDVTCRGATNVAASGGIWSFVSDVVFTVTMCFLVSSSVSGWNCSSCNTEHIFTCPDAASRVSGWTWDTWNNNLLHSNFCLVFWRSVSAEPAVVNFLLEYKCEQFGCEGPEGIRFPWKNTNIAY